ncbi:hypothetical protein N658DRAFT_288728 [Parathielavia hyrcaniae]|uniref:Uncharacterized protein n=1 Tax=Parathielavia hyrcaniae TaxID=113614 RepID=A0AAN6PT78_9PEZI|nr:hypothetical protein N658DRAFT_288728 [Parathielavia hyrcaniae]
MRGWKSEPGVFETGRLLGLPMQWQRRLADGETSLFVSRVVISSSSTFEDPRASKFGLIGSRTLHQVRGVCGRRRCFVQPCFYAATLATCQCDVADRSRAKRLGCAERQIRRASRVLPGVATTPSSSPPNPSLEEMRLRLASLPHGLPTAGPARGQTRALPSPLMHEETRHWGNRGGFDDDMETRTLSTIPGFLPSRHATLHTLRA